MLALPWPWNQPFSQVPWSIIMQGLHQLQVQSTAEGLFCVSPLPYLTSFSDRNLLPFLAMLLPGSVSSVMSALWLPSVSSPPHFILLLAPLAGPVRPPWPMCSLLPNSPHGATPGCRDNPSPLRGRHWAPAAPISPSKHRDLPCLTLSKGSEVILLKVHFKVWLFCVQRSTCSL